MDAEVRQRWDALRKMNEAAYIGLALPRYLVRQPYGKVSDPIEAFGFEEFEPAKAGTPSSHENYLWGNSSILCGYLLASWFQAESWGMPWSGAGEVGELPLFKFKDQDGESTVKPCGEAWLNDRAAAQLLSSGLIPVLSIRGRDAVRVSALTRAGLEELCTALASWLVPEVPPVGAAVPFTPELCERFRAAASRGA